MEEDIKAICLKVMQESKSSIVTTIDESGMPHSRSMFNLRNKEQWPRMISIFDKHEKDFMILLTTNTSSSKIRHIRKNNRVSIYYVTPDEWRGVMFGGYIEIVDDDELKRALWHDGWEKYYPKGYNDPDHSVLRLYPDFAEGWNQSTTFKFELK